MCQLRVVARLLSSAAGTSHSRGRPAGHQMTHFTQWASCCLLHPPAPPTQTPAVYYGLEGAHYGAWHSLWKFKTCLDVRCEGMFARFLIFSGVTKNKDMHSMKRFIASIIPDTCKFLEKRTKQSQIKSAITCKWGRKIKAMEPIIKM